MKLWIIVKLKTQIRSLPIKLLHSVIMVNKHPYSLITRRS